MLDAVNESKMPLMVKAIVLENVLLKVNASIRSENEKNKKAVLIQNPNRKSDFMLFDGRNRIRFPYSRYGYTRGNGKVWHGGVDVDGLDDSIIHFPTYHNKSISGTVVTARIVTDKRNRTWEWGYYVCVKLDANQTPDVVNYLYFCHCEKILVKVGQKVKSGDKIAVMGDTGNAALANPPFKHCHLEVRASATGKGLDPTAYIGFANAVGVYDSEIEVTEEQPQVEAPKSKLQLISIGPVSQGDADKIYNLCKELELTAQNLYKSEWVE